MTSLIQFQPSALAPFSFITTLDGQQYQCQVRWNAFGQRWYFYVATLDGVLILSEGLNGSPQPLTLSSVVWQNGFVTAKTAIPHNYLKGFTVDLTVAGCTPDAFNGSITALVVDTATIQWPLADNPGAVMTLGAVSFDLNLVEQYFQTSTVVFRDATQQFEINP